MRPEVLARSLARGAAAGLVFGVVEAVAGRGPAGDIPYTIALDTLAGALVAVVAATVLGAAAAVAGRRLESPGAWIESGSAAATVAILLLVVPGYLMNRDLIPLELGSAVSIRVNAAYGVFCAVAGIALWRALYRRTSTAPRHRRWHRLAPVALAAALVVFLLHWNWDSPLSPPAPEARLEMTGNAGASPVIIVLADAVRPDHLPLYGYDRATAPNLSDFARDCVVFDQAYASSPWTVPSVTSLFTGLYPTSHATTGLYDRLPEELETVAELLGRLGYRTGGFVGNIIGNPTYGFAQGFDTFYPRPPSIWYHRNRTAIETIHFRATREDYYNGAQLNRHALSWLDEVGERPFFVYVHYMEPHSPYDPPVRYVEEVTGGAVTELETMYPKGEAASEPPAPGFLRRIVASYDAEILRWDELFGEFVSGLKDRGLYDRALICVVADHGEEFYDHGRWGHGKALYAETLRVPCVVKLPGCVAGGRRVDGYVELVDLKASIIDYLGVESASATQGVSLLDPVDDVGGGKEAAYGHDRDGQFCIRTAGYTLIRAEGPSGEPTIELYNHREDPGETIDLAESEPRLAAELAVQLAEWMAETRAVAVSPETVEMDEERTRKLRALGYIN